MPTPLFNLELHRSKDLVPAMHVPLVVIIDFFTIAYTGAHHIGYIHHRHPLANIIGYRRVSEGVGMQREITPKNLPNFF